MNDNYFYSITKYNPKYRNISGGYERDEWTEVTNIGQKYHGKKFTKREYLKIERRYLIVIELLLSGFNINNITLRELRKSKNYIFRKDILPFAEDDIKLYKRLKNNQDFKLTKQESLIFSKLILRNELKGELDCQKFTITFGMDFYMYYESSKYPLNEDFIKEIHDVGLFVDQIN